MLESHQRQNLFPCEILACISPGLIELQEVNPAQLAREEIQKNKPTTRSTDTNADSQSMIKNTTRRQTYRLYYVIPKYGKEFSWGSSAPAEAL